jgi:hypothetical protein
LLPRAGPVGLSSFFFSFKLWISKTYLSCKNPILSTLLI